jgi:hypothetical protein
LYCKRKHGTLPNGGNFTGRDILSDAERSLKQHKESSQVVGFLPAFPTVRNLQTQYKLLVYSLENEINFASTFALIAREFFAIQAYEDGELALSKAERAHREITRLLRQIRAVEDDAGSASLHTHVAADGHGGNAGFQPSVSSL